MQINELADELRVAVGDIKRLLRANGFQRPDRDFAGAQVDLCSDEEAAVRASHGARLLTRPRNAMCDVARVLEVVGPEVTSSDVDELPAATTIVGLLPARGTEAHAVYLHEDVLRWLGDEKTPPEQRKVFTRRVQELMAHGRATRMKGVKGRNRGWLRTPVGGNGGFHFYLWLMNQGEVVAGQSDATRALHDHAPPGSRLLRMVRHHDDTKDALDVGVWTDYAPIDAQRVLAANEDGLAEPLVEAQRGVVSDRTRVRVLVGQPGSGKTTSLQAAASSLSGRALYVTWSQDLAARAKEWFAAFAPAELDIAVWTFRDLLANVDHARPIDADLPLPAAVDLLRSRLEPYGGQLGPWRREGAIRAEELFAELHAFLIGTALPVTFRGRRARGAPSMHEQDYRALRAGIGEPAIEGALLALRKLPAEDVRRLFPGPVAAFDRALDLQRGALSLDPETFAFDWVLVDEVQDLTLVEQWLLIDVAARAGKARGVKPGMIVAGDEAQTVRPTAFEFGPLSDLLAKRLDAQTDRKQHELVENLRSPAAIVELLDRTRRVLYRTLPRYQRPRGRHESGPTEVTIGRVMEVEARDDDELRRVLEIFASIPGEAAVVYPGALVPAPLKALADEVGVVVWTSETIKGLEFRLVGVLDVPDEVHRIEELVMAAEHEPLAIELARSAIDRFLVALSRTTETLVLVGARWERAGALATILLADRVDDEVVGDDRPREGHLGPVALSELAGLLEIDAADAIGQIEALLAQSERLGAVGDNEGAVRLAENAVGLLGRSGRPGSAGRDLRIRVQRRFGEAHLQTALALDRPSMLAVAARAFRAAGAKDAASIMTALAGVLLGSIVETDTCKRLGLVADSITRLAVDEPMITDRVVTRLRVLADAITSEVLVPAEPAGRGAALHALGVLASRAPSDRDAFRRAHQLLLVRTLRSIGTQRARRAEYGELRAGVEDAAVLAVLDAEHAEACGDLADAMMRWEAMARFEDALRCARGMADVDAGARVASLARSDSAAVLSWARGLVAALEGRPEGELTPAEIEALTARFQRAVVGTQDLSKATNSGRRRR